MFFLAILVAAIQVGVGARAATAGAVPLDGLGYVLLTAGPAALVWRRLSPLGTLAVASFATYAYLVLNYPRGPYFLAAFVAIVTASRASRRGAVLGVTAAPFLLVLAAALPGAWYVGGRIIDVDTGTAVGAAAWTVIALAIGEALRAQRERFAEMRRAQIEANRARAEQSRRQASDERLRIARELHDVLGHHLSLINVRAGVALHLLEARPSETSGPAFPPPLDEARDALGAIKLASAEALREVRGVLATLAPETGAAPRSPSPGLAAIEDLAAEARAAGTPVHIARTGPGVPLPGEVERAAYRIVQESLTNVRRHAGPAASVTVTIADSPDGLTVRVEDTGSGPAQSAPATAGNGIAGMAERAAALGGWLRTGRGPGDVGYVVEAFLPTPREEKP
jgi:signal transduction histidine kinase